MFLKRFCELEVFDVCVCFFFLVFDVFFFKLRGEVVNPASATSDI